MAYRILSFKDKSSSADMMEFEEAMAMAQEGFDRVCELAEEMKDQYGERRGYGYRGGYGNRGNYGMRGGYGNRYGDRDEWDDDMMYGERRRRDSRGRYM